MFHRYDYEAEYYPSLSRLPLDLRRKLDLAGIKLSLKDWQAISHEERTVLCHLDGDYGEALEVFTGYLDFLSRRDLGKALEKIAPADARQWSDAAVPQAVAQRSAAAGASVSLTEWRGWPAHHRYALYKTAVSTSQPEAFDRVLAQLRSPRAKS